MDFFGRQEEARRKTRTLVLLFALAVFCIALLVYVAAMIFFNLQEVSSEATWWRLDVLAGVVAVTLLVVTGGALFKIGQLRTGGSAVAMLLGGRPVATNTEDVHERQLLNVVEEMAIAAGMPVPDVFVLEGEAGINAFAAGYSAGDAAVAVTRGCMEELNRDELQGVIAHEFSHVFNGDMRLNIRLMGTLFGILCIAMAGYVLLRGAAYGSVARSRSSKSGGGAAAILGMGLALLVIGYVGMFFARLIKAAVSRQREFLADASAVQFTRNPGGISGALKKIGGYGQGSQVRNAHAEEASHMFFAHGLGRIWLNMLATHPPLSERIARIEPSFRKDQAAREGAAAPGAMPAGAAGFAGATAAPAAAAIKRGTAPDDLVAAVGEVRPDQVEYAQRLLEDLPLRLKAAAREPFGARCLVHATLLDGDAKIRRTQLEVLQQHGDPATAQEASDLSRDAAGLPRQARLALIEMAIPALRQLSLEQFQTFVDNVQRLVDADAETTTFEYALQKLLMRHLQRRYEPKPRPQRPRSLKQLLPYVGIVLSTLARAGHDDEESARKALADGVEALGADGAGVVLLPVDECSLKRMDKALDRVDGSHPLTKRRILLACARAVSSDGTIEPEEVELMRAIADTLDCPMPPLT